MLSRSLKDSDSEFNFDLEIGIKGHPRSLPWVPRERAHTCSY